MNEEEKNAIEYLKARLYGNEDCEYIDIAQEDLRVFINLIDRREKEIESWKNYSEELEKEKLEISNKECELEFDIEKLQKENEKLKNQEVTAKKINELLVQRYSSSVPVQKIKDKIKELKQEDREWTEELSEPSSNFKNIDMNLKRIKNQINVLQELLGGKEQKKSNKWRCI